MDKNNKYINIFGDNYSTIDPDKSDTDYKKSLVEYLKTYGHMGNKYSYVKIVSEGKDVQGYREDTGILDMFEVKGTCEDKPLIHTYGSELMEAIRNPNNFWFSVIKKTNGICQVPIFFTIDYWLKLFPLQPVSVKGTLDIRGLTQEMIDDGYIPHTNRRTTTLIATKEMIVENQELRDKQLDKQQQESYSVYQNKFFK
jgi:hypothetical protein